MNVGGSEVVSLVELARMLIDAGGTGSYELREFPNERKKIDIGNYYTDDSAFRRLTGWQPRVGLSAGLSRSVDYYRQHIARYI